MHFLGPDLYLLLRLRALATGFLWLAFALVTLLVGCAGVRQVSRVGETDVIRLPSLKTSAPSFSVPDHNGNTVSLSDFRGQWVVLYFYPSDDTPGCTTQATEFTALLEQFHEINAIVLGVSADPPLRHRFFRAKYDLDITLLSDRDHETMRKYGVWREVQWRGQTLGRVIRTTFLIDPMGQIARRWDHVIPRGHAEQVRRKLGQIDADRARTGATDRSDGAPHEQPAQSGGAMP